jgi:hypothetical protein
MGRKWDEGSIATGKMDRDFERKTRTLKNTGCGTQEQECMWLGMGGVESKPRDLGSDRGYRVAILNRWRNLSFEG